VHLDPLEEQLDLPSAFVQLGYRYSRQGQIVGQKDVSLPRFGVPVADSAQRKRVEFGSFGTGQLDELVRPQAGGSIYRKRTQPLERETLLGPRDEESLTLIDSEKPRKVDVGLVHDVEAARFQRKLIQNIDVVDLPGRDNQKAGNIAAQVDQGMDFDRAFSLTKSCPREQREAEIDGGRIESVDGLFEVHSKVFVAIESSRLGNEKLRDVGPDSPVPSFVGFGQSVASNGATESRMVELGLESSQASFDVAEAFPEGQLSEGQAHELVSTGEATDSIVALVVRDAFVELVSGKELQYLSKDGLPCKHRPLLSASDWKQEGRKQIASSSRANSFFAAPDLLSLIYEDIRKAKRDSTGTKCEIKEIAKLVYKHRCAALHEGIAFPASMCMPPMKCKKDNIITYQEKPTSMAASGAVFLSDDCPLLLHVFECVVRGCIINWWTSLI